MIISNAGNTGKAHSKYILCERQPAGIYCILFSHVILKITPQTLHSQFYKWKPISPSSKIQLVTGGAGILKWSLPPECMFLLSHHRWQWLCGLSWDRLAVPDHAEKDLKPKYIGIAHWIEWRHGPTLGIHTLSKKRQITSCQSSTT